MRPILTPNLMTENVAATVRFYQNILDFELVVGVVTMEKGSNKHNFVTTLENDTQLDWANVQGYNTELMLQSRDSLANELPLFKDTPIAASQTLYIRIDDVDTHFAKCRDNVEVVAEPTDKFYGMREWYMKDNNGYVLGFSQEIKQ